MLIFASKRPLSVGLFSSCLRSLGTVFYRVTLTLTCNPIFNSRDSDSDGVDGRRHQPITNTNFRTSRQSSSSVVARTSESIERVHRAAELPRSREVLEVLSWQSWQGSSPANCWFACCSCTFAAWARIMLRMNVLKRSIT